MHFAFRSQSLSKSPMANAVDPGATSLVARAMVQALVCVRCE